MAMQMYSNVGVAQSMENSCAMLTWILRGKGQGPCGSPSSIRGRNWELPSALPSFIAGHPVLNDITQD